MKEYRGEHGKHAMHGMLGKCHGAKSEDASTKLKGPSVNAEATRGDKPAHSPKTIGPRAA